MTNEIFEIVLEYKMIWTRKIHIYCCYYFQWIAPRVKGLSYRLDFSPNSSNQLNFRQSCCSSTKWLSSLSNSGLGPVLYLKLGGKQIN